MFLESQKKPGPLILRLLLFKYSSAILGTVKAGKIIPKNKEKMRKRKVELDSVKLDSEFESEFLTLNFRLTKYFSRE